MAHQTISISEGRRRLLELADQAKETFERFILTRNGKPELVVLNYEDYESLMETLEIYQTPGLLKELEQRAQDRAGGRVKPRSHAQVWRG
ncbi:MAG TPA: type II toxin-antitoxin system Phd/YefM family antitoxin [Candidatus Fraserbacteria bacterium]|nr:type II toxin-antitoxin system Phd/YefM family antitoxin [Candidatus Fraserbacteria bacterium]